MTLPVTRGRPPASSREMLQDAAFELFLENSYAGTTVEQITQRAGVSRNTFFNYFPAKSDVFWVELDEALEPLPSFLHGSHVPGGQLRVVLHAILAIGQGFGPSRVPFALTQYELIGSVHELQASALARFASQAKVIAGYLEQSGSDPAFALTVAYASLGSAIAGVRVWADAGTSRGELEPYLLRAVDPVISGFEVVS